MTKILIHSLFLLFCVYYSEILVINGQTLPPLETLPPITFNGSTSPIVGPFDATCISADNSTDQDTVVFLGAVALNTDNECEVICQRQILQTFGVMFAGIIRTRAVIIGSIFTTSMPDNSTCAQTGTCTNGICSVSANGTSATPTPSPMANSTETTTLMTNSTTVLTNSTSNSTAV